MGSEMCIRDRLHSVNSENPVKSRAHEFRLFHHVSAVPEVHSISHTPKILRRQEVSKLSLTHVCVVRLTEVGIGFEPAGTVVISVLR